MGLLTEKVANVDKTDGMIPLHCMGMLLYLFCDGKTEDNLLGIFNLFDEGGNGTISIDELLNMMAFFIEIGADSGKVDMATVMAEMFQKGDQNRRQADEGRVCSRNDWTPCHRQDSRSQDHRRSP